MKSIFLRNKKSNKRRYIFLISTAISFLVIFLLVNFILFVKDLPKQNSVPNLNQTSFDGIVVFTGGQFRLGTTSLIIKNGFKGPVLISGIFPGSAINQTLTDLGLDKENLKQINIDYSAVSTAGNVQQTFNWIKSNNLKKVLVVTSYYHIPRTKLLLDKKDIAEFMYYPVFSNNANFSLLFSEYIKYLLFSFNTVINISLGNQLPY